MKILVTGAQGMLGRAVLEELEGHHDAHGIDLPDGDLSDAKTVASLFDILRPEHVIHCAAYTDVDGAETHKDDAHAGNVLATKNLAEACDRHGAGLVAVSTDYVFHGDEQAGYREDHPRDPINAYGHSKAEAELAVEAMNGCGCIVRTSWLFGFGPKNFVLSIRRLLGEREQLKVVDDQRGSPTYAPDLAAVLRYLAEHGATGIYHATNAGVCSWYEFAREIAIACNADPERIQPCASSEFPTPARRPSCSVLLSTRLEKLGCPERRSWREALDVYLDLLAVRKDGRGEDS